MLLGATGIPVLAFMSTTLYRKEGLLWYVLSTRRIRMPINSKDREHILNAVKQLNIQAHNGFNNFSKNINLPETIVLDINDIPSLQAIVKTIYALNQEKPDAERILLRTAAGGEEKPYSHSYSFTNGVNADVIIRLVGQDFNKIEPAEQKNVMRIGASLQIGNTDKTLYEKYDLALPTSSLIPYVTVAGLATNAGHGTGKDQPSFSGLIQGMTLCLPNGDIVRLDAKHPDFATIRAANLGLFGIIIDLDLACIKASKMQCIMQKRSIPELIDDIKNGLLLDDPYISIMYVPTYQANELTNKEFKNVIIYRWQPIDKSNQDVNNKPILSHLRQNIEINLSEDMHITDLLRAHPEIIPYYNKYLVSHVAIGEKDSMSIGPWYTMHYQNAYPWDIDDADYLFQVHNNCNEVVIAIEQVVSTLTQFAANKQYPIVDAIYLRLFKGTNGGLSSSPHTDNTYVCGLDMVTSNGIKGYQEFKNEMSNFFINGPLKSKPHWGKYLPESVDYAKLYGDKYHAFIMALHNWYKKHDIRIENSMLLTAYFCHLLQLPYAPISRQASEISTVNTTATPSHAKTQEMIQSLLTYLDGQKEVDDVALRKRLNMLYAAHETSRALTLFKARQEATDRRDTNMQVESEKPCCAIL